MRLIRSAPTLAEIGLYKSLLDAADIACFVRNAQLFSLTGALPFSESRPELWIAHERDFARAESVLADQPEREPDTLSSWECPSCGEIIDGDFAACWSCGAAHPDAGGKTE